MLLWAELRDIYSTYAQSSTPWIVLGDFNETLSVTEHSRHLEYSVDHLGMHQFQDVVAHCGLMDLKYVGSLYTWWNHCEANPISKKLDRALINGDWFSYFPYSFATSEAGGVSDHARCLVRLSSQTSGNKRPYQFFNYLTEHPNFLAAVAQVWNSTEPLFHSRAALYRFNRKLKLLKHVLRALNRTHYGDLPNRTKEAFQTLCDVQNQALNNLHADSFQAVAEASHRWHHLASIEESFFRQKSRIQWLRLGDQNNKFFHQVAQGRASKNSIKCLVTAAGETITDLEGIKREAVNHFQSFLQAQPADYEITSVLELRVLISLNNLKIK